MSRYLSTMGIVQAGSGSRPFFLFPSAIAFIIGIFGFKDETVSLTASAKQWAGIFAFAFCLCFTMSDVAVAAQKGVALTKGEALYFRQTFERADEVQKVAEQHWHKEEYAEALDGYKAGLLLVGDSYYTTEMLDDTGMRVMLSHIEERKGNLKLAAAYVRTVLRERLQLLRERIEFRPPADVITSDS